MTSETLLRETGIDLPYLQKRINRLHPDHDHTYDTDFLKKIIDNTVGIFYLYDLKLEKYFFINSRLEEMLGYEKKSLHRMEKPMLKKLMHPDDFSKFDDFITEVSESSDDVFLESEYRLCSSEGDWKWFLSKETVYQRDEENNATKIFGIATDITNLKNTEAKIRESHANLNALIESTDDVIWSIDHDYRFIKMNSQCKKNFLAAFGMEPQKGTHVLYGLNDEQKKCWQQHYEKAFDGLCVKAECECTINGSLLHYDTTVNPVFDKYGNVTSVTCFAKDVTIQKQNAKIISQNNNLLSAIIESTQSSIFALDRNFKYIAFNANHKKTVQRIYNVEIKLGMDCTDIIRGTGDYEKSLVYLKRVLGGESFTIIEEYGLSSLQQRSVYELHYAPIKDENQLVTGISIFSLNITENVRAQQQLKIAEKKFRDIFESSPDGIFVESSGGTILDVNVAAIKLQGMSKENLIGKNIRDLVPKERYLKILRNHKQLFLGAIKTIESMVWSSRGVVPVEISGTKISYSGKPAVLLQVRDISERKKMEDERAQIIIEKSRQKEELIKTSLQTQEDERNRIATEMHDEVGSGLSKISILCEVIKRSFNDPDAVKNNIEKIISSSKEVQENISEIIWSMDPANDTLENLVAYINYFASEFLETAGMKFNFSFPPKISHISLVGKFRRNIFLIIKESLNNIVKHSGADSVNLEIKLKGDLLSISIRDNGKGFDVNHVPRFRNGLGNMQKRASEIGGQFELISSPEQGTTKHFSVLIPATY